MVKTLPPYDPPNLRPDTQGEEPQEESRSGLIRFNIRVMTRKGEVLIDFGEFKDLLAYNDSLSIESPAGSFTLKMRATLCNEELLKKIHPGSVIEVYCARNDDPLKEVEAFTPQVENPPVFEATGEAAGIADQYKPVNGAPQPPPAPEEPDYLDKAPYLLLRGITTSYGRSSAVMEGGGGETTLTLSGESYGKIYRDAQVLVDSQAPVSLGTSLEATLVRLFAQDTLTVVPLYYGILRHWVEEFWGKVTGWEARTRPIPVQPEIFARIQPESSAWNALQSLSVQGLFHMFTDHTGAICWEKIPYSGKCQALIDQHMTWSEGYEFRNWENLQLLKIPSWQIQAWGDRLSCDRMANFVRCQASTFGGAGAQGSNLLAGQCYNMGSIRQYGGPRKMEIQIPANLIPGRLGDLTLPPEAGQAAEGEQRLNTFMDLVALETIRWYDRPVQRVMLSVRGDAAWRINTRVAVVEDWHCPEAEPGEYYVISRGHSINLQQGSWSTQIEAVRDRRTRYLGAGMAVEREEVKPQEIDSASFPATGDDWNDGQFADGELTVEPLTLANNPTPVPIEADEFYFFDRLGAEVKKIEDLDEFVKQWVNPECLVEEGAEPAEEAQ